MKITRLLHRLRKPGREAQSSLANTSLHELSETELVDRHPALGKSRDAFLILVEARSAVADVSEASPRGEPKYPHPTIPISNPSATTLSSYMHY